MLVLFFPLLATTGVTDHGTSYNILLIYELKFNHKATNMLIGPLGQTKGEKIIFLAKKKKNSFIH